MKRPIAFSPAAASLLVLLGCASTVQNGPGSGADSGVTANPGVPAAVASCGGHTCQPGEICCFRSGECIAPDSGACRASATVAREGPCASNADCPSDQRCFAQDCLGDGQCRTINTNACGANDGDTLCGCDGVTYVGSCALDRAGVRYAAAGPCGVGRPQADASVPAMGCGRDEQCRSGTICCPTLSLCVVATACPPPRDDGRVPCMENNQCSHFLSRYCAGDGCGTPGYCDLTYTPNVGCPPIIDPVCGCDGQIYQSACLMRSVGMRGAPAERCRR